MPTYEFKHKASGEVVERWYSMAEAPRELRVGRRKYERILSAPSFIVDHDSSNGRKIDFVSNALDYDTYKGHHIGQVVKDKYGKPQLHFGSRHEIEHLKRSYNASDDAQREGKQLRYGECDEWRDALRAEGDRDLKPDTGKRLVPGSVASPARARALPGKGRGSPRRQRARSGS